MLKEVVGWYGSFVAAYQSEVDAWRAGHDDDPTTEHASVQCSNEPSAESFETVVSDLGSWLTSKKVVVLYGVEAWPIADLRKYVDGLKSLSSDVHLAMTAYGWNTHLGKYLDPIVTFADRGVPVDFGDRTIWAEELLRAGGVSVRRQDLRALFDICADDTRASAEIVVSVANSFDGDVSRELLLSSANLGPVEVNVLVAACLEGRRKDAYLAYERMSLAGHGLIFIATVLMNRLRLINAAQDLSDSEVVACGLAKSTGQMYYVRKEASGLTQQMLDRGMVAVSEAVESFIYSKVPERDSCVAMISQITDATSRTRR